MEDLTDRQRTVLEYLVTGWSRKNLADELHVNVNTVHTILNSIISRAQTASLIEAIYKYTKAGMI